MYNVHVSVICYKCGIEKCGVELVSLQCFYVN